MSRIYFAGAESIELLKTLVEHDVQDIMLSFYYLQQRAALPQVVRLLTTHPHLRIFLDSGATTFGKKDRGDPHGYWLAYFQCLKKYGDRFEYASEFDLDGYAWDAVGIGKKPLTKTVDKDQLDAWRDDLVELGTVPIVPIWHPWRGTDEWDRYCQDTRFPHLGISRGVGGHFDGGPTAKSEGRGFEFLGGQDPNFKGGASRISRGASFKNAEGVAPKSSTKVIQLSGKHTTQFIAQAHGYNKTIHGYSTDLADLKYLKFDTLASTTWLVGQKYGDVCTFERGHFDRIYTKHKGALQQLRRSKKYFLAAGCDHAKILKLDPAELTKANVWAFRQLSQRLQILDERRGAIRKVPIQPLREDAFKPSQTAQERATGTPPPSTAVEAELVAQVQSVAKNGKLTRVAPAGDTENASKHVSVTQTQEIEQPISIQTNRPFMPPDTPGLMCSNCAMSLECPKYQEGHTCFFKPTFGAVHTRDVNEVVEELGSIFAVNVERARFLRLREEIQGGGIVDKEVTQQMESTFHMGAKLADLMKGKKRTTTTVGGQGALTRLFGRLGQEQPGAVQIAGETEEEDSPHYALPEPMTPPEPLPPDLEIPTRVLERQARTRK